MSVARAVFRANKSLMRSMIDRYYAHILSRSSATDYSVILVVKGEVVPEWFLASLRERQPTARVIFYAYDSIASSHNWRALERHFTDAYSFDSQDVAQHDKLRYKPLFYAPEFRPGPHHGSRMFDVSFIGTLHSDRFDLISAAFAAFDETRTFRYLYMPARWYYWLNRMGNAQFRGVQMKDVSFQKLSRNEVARVLRQSRVVLDVQRPNQSGLTMRTFEAIASGAHVATTNRAIAREWFYDPKRILIIEPGGGTAVANQIREFLAQAPEESTVPQGFSQYAVENWAYQLVAGN
jgi:hypothetical protein